MLRKKSNVFTPPSGQSQNPDFSNYYDVRGRHICMYICISKNENVYILKMCQISRDEHLPYTCCYDAYRLAIKSHLVVCMCVCIYVPDAIYVIFIEKWQTSEPAFKCGQEFAMNQKLLVEQASSLTRSASESGTRT